ncbi:hypothetical protein PCANC_10419 [Puccinia coronata f. sp. avenae]|uniref:PX domain-containing protein n=1 Tax=Puccinia coronata f. sp. avenae TaxID=200324 RepID=A0A2N5STU5_9BASI|nr:hypothetical protein PCANC_10419 [Puccinia coronata f. sp. avenae]
MSKSPLLEDRDSQLSVTGGLLSASHRSSSSSSSSSPPQIPFKPGHLRSISSQVRVQNRIIQAVDIRQESAHPIGSHITRSPPPPACQPAVDQSTIKAPRRRPPRESLDAIHKIPHTSTRSNNLAFLQDGPAPVGHSSRAAVDLRLRSLDSQLNSKSFPVAGLTNGRHDPSERLSLAFKHEQPLKSVPRTQGVMGDRSKQGSTTFTPLTIPQQAIGLYCFTPEPCDGSEEASSKDEDDDVEKVTPEVGFQAGDLLEIWVPDIGGGWSLGRNVSSSQLQSSSLSLSRQSVETQASHWGLIPIGWYKIVEASDTPRRQSKPKQHTPNGRFPLSTHTHSSEASLPQSKARQISAHLARLNQEEHHRARNLNISSPLPGASDLFDLDVSSPNHLKPKTEAGRANTLQDLPNSIKRSNSLALYLNNVSERASVSSRSSGYFLSPPMLNASVAVNKEFDPNGIHFDYPSRGIACSVTASDAMYAARQAADRQALDPVGVPGGKAASSSRGSSWNPFFRNRPAATRRHSLAHSYILGEQDSLPLGPEDLDPGCTERYEIRAGPAWKDSAPRFMVQVHSPKLQVHPSNTKTHVLYTLTSSFPDHKCATDDHRPANDVQVTVARRYSHFELLAAGLHSLYGEVIDLPALPEKRLTSNYDSSFVESRRRALERYLFRLTRHPVLRYSPRLTSFLGCEDVEEFEEEARAWSRHPDPADPSQKNAASHSAASSSFFSKVFHPDYNVDEADAAGLVDAYSRHTRSVENARGMVELEKSLAAFRGSLHDVSQNMQKVSSSIQRLCVAQPPPHNYIPFDGQKKTGIPGSHAAGYGSSKGMQDGYEKGQKGRLKDEDLMRNLRGDSQISGLENSENDGMCWKEDCHDCLVMNNSLLRLGHSFAAMANSYSCCASETLAPVEALAKELSFPHKNRKVISSLHDSTKVEYSDVAGMGSIDTFESRKETVLNVVMSEMERQHQEKNQDVEEMARRLLDSQIQLHETACWELKEVRKAMEETAARNDVEQQSGTRRLGGEEMFNFKGVGEGEGQVRSSHAGSFTTARSQWDMNHPTIDGPLLARPTSVLDWIHRSASYSTHPPDETSLQHRKSFTHHRHSSIHSHSGSVASSTFDAVFVKPLSAAVSSIVELSSDFLS